MELDDIVAARLKEVCEKRSRELLERAMLEASKPGAQDHLAILSLLRAANIVRGMPYLVKPKAP